VPNSIRVRESQSAIREALPQGIRRLRKLANPLTPEGSELTEVYLVVPGVVYDLQQRGQVGVSASFHHRDLPPHTVLRAIERVPRRSIRLLIISAKQFDLILGIAPLDSLDDLPECEHVQ